MKKGELIATLAFILIFAIVISLAAYMPNVISGKTVSNNNQPGSSDAHQIGPSQQEMQCMMKCMGCSSPGVGCTGNQQECQTKCNVKKPEQTEDEKCVETCVRKGCGEFDFTCQQKNQAVCDKECGMIKEPEAKSEEERCIKDCVNKESPGLICRPGEGGEKGDSICQQCAKSCEHLYAGPCLTEIKLESAKSACNTCEHCYGEPKMGDSGEGYQCIVSVECKDSSGEFGDTPGTGEGVSKEKGFTERVTGTAKNIVNSVTNFFKRLFGSGSSEQETKEAEVPASSSSESAAPSAPEIAG